MTSATQTVFQLDLPEADPAKLDEAFKLLSGMIEAPVINEVNVRTEVPIVLAEKRERGGPNERVANESRDLFFHDQMLAKRPPIGTEETLEAATAEDVEAFYKRWYRPQKTVIAVAGDADPVALASLIEKNFGDWQGLSWNQMMKADPKTYNIYWSDPTRNRPPGGESFADQIARTGVVIDRLGEQHKGRNRGLAERGNRVSFGDYGLKSTDRGRLTSRQIEAARRAINRYVKRGGRVWIRVFPDKPISKKPLEVRMGKGKGNPEYWVALVQPGTVLYEIQGVDETSAREAFRLAGAKLPVRTIFVSRQAA